MGPKVLYFRGRERVINEDPLPASEELSQISKHRGMPAGRAALPRASSDFKMQRCACIEGKGLLCW